MSAVFHICGHAQEKHLLCFELLEMARERPKLHVQSSAFASRRAVKSVLRIVSEKIQGEEELIQLWETVPDQAKVAFPEMASDKVMLSMFGAVLRKIRGGKGSLPVWGAILLTKQKLHLPFCHPVWPLQVFWSVRNTSTKSKFDCIFCSLSMNGPNWPSRWLF